MQLVHDILRAGLTAMIFACLGTLCVGMALAQVMESTNYKLQSDSVNIGGGLSTSSSYTLESTAGEIATGEGTSENYELHAGYQQMQEVYIAISGANDVSMAPAVPTAGGTATGTTSINVLTDSPSGYELTIKAANSPAMQSGANTIDDYAPAGADPDFTFTTAASDAHLGYSPYGDDVVDRFLDNGAACNTGSSNAVASCWDGLATTTESIAMSTSANHPSGATTTVYFRLGVGAAASPATGTYVATTTVTALPL